MKARSNGAKLCSKCQKPCPGYDTLFSRDFRFIPMWGMTVFFRYVPRRVTCPEHGIIVEWMPWAEGKSPLTNALKTYLAQWAKHLSWQTVAEIYKVTWKNVFESVEYIENMDLSTVVWMLSKLSELMKSNTASAICT